MSGCFMCSPGSMQRSNEAVIMCTHSYIHTHSRPSKQSRLGPLRGADSFLGKWEPAGFDKHTHTHIHTCTHTNQTTSCAWTQHFPAMFIYSIHSRSLFYLSPLSCPLPLTLSVSSSHSLCTLTNKFCHIFGITLKLIYNAYTECFE